ncbi:hypothetical protein CSPX01_07337 [Colletotrichum filicis]|nr:hypothetical protein CSPX01_07337 [Colletotrichum filicis]
MTSESLDYLRHAISRLPSPYERPLWRIRGREASERATDDTDKSQVPYADLWRGRSTALILYGGPYYNFWGPFFALRQSLRKFFAAAAPPSLSLARFMQKRMRCAAQLGT